MNISLGEIKTYGPEKNEIISCCSYKENRFTYRLSDPEQFFQIKPLNIFLLEILFNIESVQYRSLLITTAYQPSRRNETLRY